MICKEGKFEITSTLSFNIPSVLTKQYDGTVLSGEANCLVSDTNIFYSTNSGESWKSQVPSITNVGEINVVAKVCKSGSELARKSYRLEVTPRKLVVTASSGQSKVYGEADSAIQYSVSGTLPTETPLYTGSLSRESGEDAGTYLITFGDLALSNNGLFVSSNYVLELDEQAVYYTIEKANTLTVSLASSGFIYDGNTHKMKAEANIKDGTKITYSINGQNYSEDIPEIKDAGLYNISVKAEKPNYNTATSGLTLIVSPKKLNVSGTTSEPRKYNGTTITSVKLGTLSQMIEGDEVSLDESKSTAHFVDKNAGDSKIVHVHYELTGKDSKNYTIEDEDIVSSILRKDLIIVSGSDTKIYDGTPLTNSNVTGNGFVEGEGLDFDNTYGYGTITGVGVVSNIFQYLLDSNTDSSNYEIELETGTLTVIQSENSKSNVDTSSIEKVLEYLQANRQPEEPLITGVFFDIKEVDIDEIELDMIEENNEGKHILPLSINISLAYDSEIGDPEVGFDSSPNLITFTYDFDFTDTKDVEVCRVHMGKEGLEYSTLTTSPNEKGEYIELDKANNRIIIHACIFSTYAITYQDDVKTTIPVKPVVTGVETPTGHLLLKEMILFAIAIIVTTITFKKKS